MASVALFALAVIVGTMVAPLLTTRRTAKATSQAISSKSIRTVRAVPWLSWSSICAAMRVARSPGCVHELTAAMCQRYGRSHPDGVHSEASAFALRIPGWRRQLVALSSPSAFEDVLRKEFASFPKGEYQCDNMRDPLGDGIFAVDGDKWRHQRRTASRLFTARALRESMTAVVKHHASVLTCELGKQADKKSSDGVATVDLFELFNRFTFDVFAEIGFGVTSDSLSTVDADAATRTSGCGQEKTVAGEFQRAFDSAQRVVARRFVRPAWLWRTLRWLNVGLEAQLKRDLLVIDTAAAAMINEYFESMTTADDGSTTAGKHATIVSLVLGDRQGADNTRNDSNSLKTELRDAVVNFMLAGRDTTAQTLTWLFYCLLKNPRAESKLRGALHDAGSAAMHLGAALRETLRLYPPVPFTTKDASRDVVLSDGTPIRAGTTVGLAFYAMGRDPCVWGADADAFRPERWLETTEDGGEVQIKNESAFTFTAFNAGPRTCLGANLAMLELKTVAATLLCEFRFESAPTPSEGLEVEPDLALTLPPRGGLRVRVRRTSASE